MGAFWSVVDSGQTSMPRCETHASAPAERWDGVRDGSRFGAMCPQIVGEEVKGDEDCRYINVWRPREKSDRPLPVMVWLLVAITHDRAKVRPTSSQWRWRPGLAT